MSRSTFLARLSALEAAVLPRPQVQVPDAVEMMARAIGQPDDWQVQVKPMMPVAIYSLKDVRDEKLGAAVGQSLTPSLAPAGTIAFLALAAALGTAAGAVFALVAQRAPAGQVGAVTGVVGAAGGLGGFVPPLVMGSIYGASRSYAWGLLALAIVAAAAMAYSISTRRQAVTSQGA